MDDQFDHNLALTITNDSTKTPTVVAYLNTGPSGASGEGVP